MEGLKPQQAMFQITDNLFLNAFYPPKSSCKAYLDLEAEAGAMTAQEGQTMCDEVIREWRRRINNRWPKVTEQCPRSLGYMILRGNRLTGDGLKIRSEGTD